MDLQASKNSFSCIKEARMPKGSDNKTNTVLKDINVQFFPCKICGAKFPSYYFVHKHKKMWHTDEATDNENELEVSDQEYNEHSSRSIKLDKNWMFILNIDNFENYNKSRKERKKDLKP